MYCRYLEDEPPPGLGSFRHQLKELSSGRSSALRGGYRHRRRERDGDGDIDIESDIRIHKSMWI